jgi:single-strand DNA-binding protein
MINRVILVGRITKDPEIRYTSNNIATVSFTIACNRTYTSANGETQTDFINCVAWRNQAEFLSRYVKKGYLVGVEGRIQTRSYQANDNTTRYVTEVVCDSVQNLQARNSESGNNYQAQPTNTQNQKVESEANFSDITDDDLPF